MLSDVRFTLRALRNNPGFAGVAVVTLGLGIGATTAIFSLVNAVLLRRLPVPEPDGLVAIQEVRERGQVESILSLPGYLDYRDRARGLSGLAAHHVDDITLNTGEASEVTLSMDVSANYFEVLGITPALGRFFSDAEAPAGGAPPVAVISHAFWQDRLGGDPGIIGRGVRVNGQLLTVIGVSPAGFHGTMLGARAPVYLPIGLHDRLHAGTDSRRRGREWLQLFGRLAPGTTRGQAEAALSVTAQQLADAADALVQGSDGAPPRMRSD